MFGAFLTWVRFLALALALSCQISAGAAVPLRDAALAQARLVSALAVFCQSGTHPAKPDGTPLHRQVADHGLSAQSHQAVAVLDGGAFFPRPSMARIGEAALPGARAPPSRHLAAAYPRGPPAPV